MGTTILLIIVQLLVIVNAQTCTEYATSNISNYLCDQFVSKYVYLPPNTTIKSIHSSIATQIKYLSLQPSICSVKAIELFCQTSFQTCQLQNRVPIPPCKSKCHIAREECSPYLQQGENFDCNKVDSNTGLPTWPENITVYNFSNGTSVNVVCNGLASVNNNISLGSCPYAMEFSPHASPSESPCQIRCPKPIFSIDEYELELGLIEIISWISLVLSLFVVISYIALKDFPRGELRKKRLFQYFPFRFHFIFATFMLNVSLLIGPLGGKIKFLCHNGLPSTQDYSPCAAQGALVFFFASATASWGISLVIYIYVTSLKVTATDENSRRYFVYYMLFGWGYPIIALIIALSTSKFGFHAPTVFCFLSLGGTGGTVTNIVFIAPFCVYSAICILLLAKVIVWVKLEQAKETKFTTIVTKFRPYYSLFAYSAFLIAYCLITIATRYYLSSKNDTLSKKFDEWMRCNIAAYTTGGLNCGATPNILSKWTLRMQYLALSLPGTFSFMMFGLDDKFLRLYRETLAKIFPSVGTDEKPYPLHLRSSKRFSNLDIPTNSSEENQTPT